MDRHGKPPAYAADSRAGAACHTKAPADWTKRLRVASADNPPVVRSAVPFEYEPFDHPKLALLCHRYELDRVVAGAAGEFEVITRLAAWASKQFSGGHLAEAYPAWDATEILAPHAGRRV